jgi:hypothetical protein
MNARTNRSFSRIWRWPFVLAALITFGLLSALLGQGGIWWAMSWIALAIPLLVVTACVHRAGRAVPPA